MTGWIQTYTGKQFWPLEPRIEDIDIRDIAHALSNLCRFAGHVEQFYSVAQHSVLVSHIVPPQHALRGLLHDASEAYLIDLPRPIKHAAVMGAYRAAEAHLQGMIYERFGLKPEDPESVKSADNRIFKAERRDLLKASRADWQDFDVAAVETKITPWTPLLAETLFKQRFNELSTNGCGSVHYRPRSEVTREGESQP